MTITIFALSMLWLAGFQICRQLGAMVNAELHPGLEAGAGFFLAAALLVLWLTSAPLALSTAGWGAVVMSTAVSLPMLQMLKNPNQTAIRTNLNLHKLAVCLPYVLIIMLFLAHVLLVLANNLTRDIYPWDAFTTWMYRAKVWVLNDEMFNFQSVNQWLQAEGQGYAIAAARYPASVSAIAAFSSALSGEWNDQLASIPWLFATLATCSIMYGLCRQSRFDTLSSLIGLYLLASIPLVGMHGMLAGYADLWMLGTSGMGLSALLLWSQQQHRSLLFYGATLLLIGCSFKTEGWLWLGMGILFVFIVKLWQQYRYLTLFCFIAVILASLYLKSTNLGPLGHWGIDEGAIYVGPLGQYSLRSYNALPDYLEVIFMRANFNLLGVLYPLALASLTFKNWRASVPHWLMGGLIFISQWIIFGLSEYSLYAETRTSINRLLLHFLPIFVLTIIAAWQTDTRKRNQSIARSETGTKTRTAQATITLVFLVISLASPVFVLLDWDQDERSNQEAHYTANLLVPVIGKVKHLESGRLQFIGTTGPVGVAKVRMKNPGSLQPRYVMAETWTSSPEAVSFYWINTGDPQIKSYRLRGAGPTILDMKAVPAFWRKPVTEMGYIVERQALTTTQLGALRLSDFIGPKFTPALVTHWLTPDSVSQRTINMVDGHSTSPVTWGNWATIAALLGVALAFTGSAATKFRFPAVKNSLILLTLVWISSDLLYLKHAQATIWPLITNDAISGRSLNTGMGERLPDIARLITTDEASSVSVIAVSLDQSGDLYAQKLPLMVAPYPAVSISIQRATRLAETWQGQFILFSNSRELLFEEADNLTSKKRFQITAQGDDYVVLALKSP